MQIAPSERSHSPGLQTPLQRSDPQLIGEEVLLADASYAAAAPQPVQPFAGTMIVLEPVSSCMMKDLGGVPSPRLTLYVPRNPGAACRSSSVAPYILSGIDVTPGEAAWAVAASAGSKARIRGRKSCGGGACRSDGSRRT